MGTDYCGWQFQPNAVSVQEKLEFVLSVKLREKVTVVGAGRTDSGVHASYYVAHFDSQTHIENGVDFVYHVNAMLPHDIALYSITPVADDAHARFDAVKREYKYYVSIRKTPLLYISSYLMKFDLDVEAMNRAAQMLLSHTDFTSFSKLHTDTRTNNCHIFEAQWTFETPYLLVFTIAANRFLRNMVRAIVGTLLDVGRGKITPEEFGEIMRSMDRSRASTSAPAKGLFLTNVQYPQEKFMKCP